MNPRSRVSKIQFLNRISMWAHHLEEEEEAAVNGDKATFCGGFGTN